MKRGLFLTCLLVLVLAATARAQTTGAILGTVTDESGAVLPGVAVTATHAATKESRTAHTGAAGTYALPQLPLGEYIVRAELAGFRTIVRSGVEVTLNRQARLDLIMAVGELAENVVVVGDAPLVESSTNEMGTVVDQLRIEQLPLNGRNTLSLVSLVPGAQQVEARPEQGFTSTRWPSTACGRNSRTGCSPAATTLSRCGITAIRYRIPTPCRNSA